MQKRSSNRELFCSSGQSDGFGTSSGQFRARPGLLCCASIRNQCDAVRPTTDQFIASPADRTSLASRSVLSSGAARIALPNLSTRLTACAQRLLSTVGPILLFALTFVVMHSGGGWFTNADLAFLIVLGITIVGRCAATEPDCGAADARFRQSGPAFLEFPVVIVLGLAVWVVANILGNHLLKN